MCSSDLTAERGVNRRNEYRFAMPLAARLDGVLGTVDDLSPSGMSFYGVLGQAKIGDRVPVTLYLPDGELEAKLEIRTLMHAGAGEQAYVRAIGGIFHAMPPALTQRIEQFLYGSDAQWRINRYRDDSPTPLQRMGLVDTPHAPREPVGYWAGCEVATDAACADGRLVGLVSAHAAEKGEAWLLLNRQLDPACRHVIQAHGRTGPRTLHAKTAAHETILTGLGALHLYRLELLADPAACASRDAEPMVHAAIAAGSRA